MIDIGKQVEYWRIGAAEDWEVAQDLIERGRVRHGLFLAHLAVEKLLKAHVCHKTQDLAPRIHNLVRLAEVAGLSMSQAQIDLLAEVNAFNVEGRYPELQMPAPTKAQVQAYRQRIGELVEWLTSQLSKV